MKECGGTFNEASAVHIEKSLLGRTFIWLGLGLKKEVE